jgi:hypothetical protein
MRSLCSKTLRFRKVFRQMTIAAAGLLLAAPAFAQGNSPWENAVNVLQQAFTSTIARGLSLVAIVVSGLTSHLAKAVPSESSPVSSLGLAWPSPPSTSSHGSFREARGRRNPLAGEWHDKRQASEPRL